ncbi:MAG: MBL fold metallo-hydrolase [Candidatus Micrarchaeota archaeon]|nr:MBL fold metallo-hydrolase [Candidatus Micrarchaeota archaeon]
MEITFLGTRGWYSKKGQTSCVLVETKGGNYLLDAGTGIYWINEVVDFSKPTCLLLSHFHLDHILGITSFSKTIKRKELTIYGEKGVKKAVDRIMRKPIYPFYFDSPLFKVKVKFKELKRKQGIFDSVIKTAHLSHSDPVLGIRIENNGRSFVYATDTLPCDATVRLARNCDVLVHETYFSDEDFKNVKINTGHSSPRGAARIAREAGAKGLFLFHFNPEYDDKTIAGMVESARGVFKNTFASKEFLKIKL